MVRILAIGDVVAQSGCDALRRLLPALKKSCGADITIVNGENSADGNGITPYSAQNIFDSGADVITGGNHTFRRREIYEMLDENPFLLRPDNYPSSAYGGGYCVVDKGAYRAAVINLQGVVFMDALSCPFEAADRLVERAKSDGCKIIIVDFHAEATSEKRALGFYLDGRITSLFGTHTHVRTADAQILSGGTSYITDVGFSGPVNSVLGVEPAQSIALLKNKLPVRFIAARGECALSALLITADEKTGKTVEIESMEIR